VIRTLAREDLRMIRRTLTFGITIIAICFSLVFAADSIGPNVPVYMVIPMEYPEDALYADVLTLGLDISEAKLEKDHRGWWIFSSDEFEIRRLKNSGRFTYLNKSVNTTKKFEVGSEPVFAEDLEEIALKLLEPLGIPMDQVDAVLTRRIVDQAEDEFGNDIGPPVTVAFKITVTRQIGGIRVVDSDASVLFNAEGNLKKIRTSWREIEPIPVAYEAVVAETDLREASLRKIEANSRGSQFRHYSGGYSFKENIHREVQEFFRLQYCYMYQYEDGSELQFGAIPAVR